MRNLDNLGFDNWFKDKIDLSKTADFWESIPSGKIARVISVNKNSKRLGLSASAKPKVRLGGLI